MAPKSLAEDQRLVTVCSSCLRASCWHGLFYCDSHRTASTIQRTVGALRRLDLEHPCYWEEEAGRAR